MRNPAVLLIVLALTLASARAQSNDSDTANSDAPKPKAHRVWDNESIQGLHGGINVVGESASPKQSTASVQTTPRPPRSMGPQYKGNTIDGQPFNSDQLLGRPVLVQFWTTWCPHCRADQPQLDRVASAYRNQGLVVLAVNYDEPTETVAKYLASSPREVPIVLSKDTDITSLFTGKKSFPRYVMINANGAIVDTKMGEAHEQGFRNMLAKAGVQGN